MANAYDAYGLGGMLGAQGQWYGIQQQALNVWPLITTSGQFLQAGAGDAVPLLALGGADANQPTKAASDSALAWLDRRVEEMSVRL